MPIAVGHSWAFPFAHNDENNGFHIGFKVDEWWTLESILTYRASWPDASRSALYLLVLAGRRRSPKQTASIPVASVVCRHRWNWGLKKGWNRGLKQWRDKMSWSLSWCIVSVWGAQKKLGGNSFHQMNPSQLRSWMYSIHRAMPTQMPRNATHILKKDHVLSIVTI